MTEPQWDIQTPEDQEAYDAWLAAFEGDFETMEMSSFEYDYYYDDYPSPCGEAEVLLPVGMVALGVWIGDPTDLAQDIDNPDLDVYMYLPGDAGDTYHPLVLELPGITFKPDRITVRILADSAAGTSSAGHLNVIGVWDKNESDFSSIGVTDDPNLLALDPGLYNGTFVEVGVPTANPTIYTWHLLNHDEWVGGDLSTLYIHIRGIVNGIDLSSELRIHAVEVTCETFVCPDCPEPVGSFGDGTDGINKTEVSISAGGDDGYYYPGDLPIGATDFVSNSDFLRFGVDRGNAYAYTELTTFLTFRNVNIPQGGTINNALITFVGYAPISGSESHDLSLRITGHCTGDSSPPTTRTGAMAMERHHTRVLWQVNQNTWYDDNVYTTPDIAELINEIVNHPDWVSGNDLTIFFENDGSAWYRPIHSFDSTTADPPKLTAWWIETGGVVAGGTAFVETAVIEITSGGVLTGGTSLLSFDLTVTGGAVTAGSAIASGSGANITSTGGVVAAGSGTGAMVLTNDLGNKIGEESDIHWTGFARFENIPILQGASIALATLELYSISAGTGRFIIYGDDQDNPAIITDNTEAEARSLTSAYTDVNESWSTSTTYEYNVTSVIQELINRGDWTTGDAVQLLFKNVTGYREFRDLSGVGSGGHAAILTIYAEPAYTEYVNTGSGGVRTAGTATVYAVRVLIATGGARTAGAATFVIRYFVTATGGARTGGTATVAKITANINATGGVRSGGTATVAKITANINATGGIRSAGAATVAKVAANINATGGARTAGSADLAIIRSAVATGGCVCASSATIQVISNVTATGGVVVAGTTLVTESDLLLGTGGVIAAGSATQYIIFNVTATGGTRTAGTGDDDEYDIVYPTGGAVTSGTVEITVQYNVTATGGVVISGTLTTQDAEVGLGGIVASGSAIHTVVSQNVSTDGVLAGGSGTFGVIQSVVATGGAVTSGTATFGVIVATTITGGSATSGSAIATLYVNVTATGGAVTSGLADISVNYYATGTGGSVCSGTSLVAVSQDAVDGTGGSVAGGSASDTMFVYETATGGAVVSGLADVQDTEEFFEVGSGNVHTDGRAILSVTRNTNLEGGISVSGSSTVIEYISVEAAGGNHCGGAGDVSVVVTKETSGGIELGGNGFDHMPDSYFVVGSSTGVRTGGQARSVVSILVLGGSRIGGSAVVDRSRSNADYSTENVSRLIQFFCNHVIDYEETETSFKYANGIQVGYSDNFYPWPEPDWDAVCRYNAAARDSERLEAYRLSAPIVIQYDFDHPNCS